VLLLDDTRLEERRTAARGPLAPLHDSLAAELAPLLGRAPYIPRAKALLSRAGGRCEIDGAVLDFDPFSPHAHRCPSCGRTHKGELHDRAWVTSYQLWLAERAVHGALFHVLRGDATHATLAREILRAYAEEYLQYPNRDNVLGPTRLFFSTYLESIWLLQICIAADLLAKGGDTTTADLVRDRIVEPSSRLIAEYDEGMSNRQVWNNAALLASAALRADGSLFDRRVDGESGLLAHLSSALLRDGTWYEGENYHQFALRGLWYGVVLCEARGREIPRELLERFHRAFAAPFHSALPDFTMPSRKDSQYAVSLRQWRLAELTELGFAREESPVLAGALGRCYEQGHDQGDTGRARSTADVERNGPPTALNRADLGWRALLHARPELPALPSFSPRSAILEHQGLAIFRRAGDVYVGVDYGQSGGGHGHPDRLNLLLSHGETRWLDDLGTGSYVDPSLHWYRSTLAHNAPLVGGRSQAKRDGVLRAYDEREAVGWIVAELLLPDLETQLERTIVVAPDYLIDELRWSAPTDVRVELPWHLDAPAQAGTFAPATLDGAGGLEDGFSFVRDCHSTNFSAGSPLSFEAKRDGRHLAMTAMSDRDLTLFTASAPGQPAALQRRFHLLRAGAREGRFRAVLAWSPDVTARFENDAVVVGLGADERHTHRRNDAGWHVELLAAGARSSIDLGGFRAVAEQRRQPMPAPFVPTVLRRSKRSDTWLSALSREQRASLLTFELSEPHYRRSEDSWKAAGSPHATIALAADENGLVVFARIFAGERHFAAVGSENPFDNEPPDTMSAGLQLYARSPDMNGAWMLVPEAGGAVRVRPIKDWGAFVPPKGRWREDDQGYEVRIELPLPTSRASAELPLDIDLIVNETTAQRARRRGQLVLSGARGEFVYLRGDRHDAARLIPLVIVP
jgi:hypothetical protein